MYKLRHKEEEEEKRHFFRLATANDKPSKYFNGVIRFCKFSHNKRILLFSSSFVVPFSKSL
jgi:hypothetical protein